MPASAHQALHLTPRFCHRATASLLLAPVPSHLPFLPGAQVPSLVSWRPEHGGQDHTLQDEKVPPTLPLQGHPHPHVRVRAWRRRRPTLQGNQCPAWGPAVEGPGATQRGHSRSRARWAWLALPGAVLWKEAWCTDSSTTAAIQTARLVVRVNMRPHLFAEAEQRPVRVWLTWGPRQGGESAGELQRTQH